MIKGQICIDLFNRYHKCKTNLLHKCSPYIKNQLSPYISIIENDQFPTQRELLFILKKSCLVSKLKIIFTPLQNCISLTYAMVVITYSTMEITATAFLSLSEEECRSIKQRKQGRKFSCSEEILTKNSPVECTTVQPSKFT